MDYSQTLLVMEDDLDEEVIEDAEMVEEINTADEGNVGSGATPTAEQTAGNSDPGPSGSIPGPEWCVCGHCRPMPQEIENKCCRQRTCIALTAHFNKLCLEQDVMQLSI